MASPWLRLNADFHLAPKLVKARAAGIWPHVLAALKRGDGHIDEDELDPEVFETLTHIPADVISDQIEGLKRVGLLVQDDGGWTTPGWDRYQPDPGASDRAKAWREANDAKSKAKQARTEPNSSHSSNGSERTERVRTPDWTGRDGTGQEHVSKADAFSPPGGGTPTPSPAPEVEPERVEPKKLSPAEAKRAEEAVEVYAHWLDTTNRRGTAAERLTTGEAKRRLAKVRARLASGYTAEQIKRAVEACWDDTWHYEHGKTDLEYVCRKLDEFLTARGRRAPPGAKRAVASVNDAWRPNPNPKPVPTDLDDDPIPF